ncbi:baseplate wedge subunit [Prochlorococcus phage P-TIM68]|uniref:Putative baseplate wedge protein n=1 Tax=Prochlorococcus phage P-TIM68 TaxID=1542477 RepID=A0A0K0KW55_9CAUD|nr:baseplate wedge subunit [Prochlorococcus phage P-TIM68]AIR93627.1 putative baseplate wedge protein [Prochlorococcus phage P-TIM68]
MPVQRRSKGFLDLSASFQENPLTNDLIALKNENAIARSVRNLVLTIQGERPFQPVLGTGVSQLLFENMDRLTAAAIRSEIRTTIENFEPRVEINEILVEPDFEGNAFNVTLQYFIIGIDVPEQELTFALEPTR